MFIFIKNRFFLSRTITFLSALFFLIAAVGQANAQYDRTAGVTPSLLTPGTPAGTYPLDGFDTVNLYNGNMNFSLPILTIKGRGSVSHTINLRIEQRWQVDGYSAAFGIYTPVAHWWTGIEPGYGPGVMEGRQLNEACGDMFYAGYQMTRLYFTAPNGTEVEFRDQESRGESKNGNCYPHGIYNNPFNRKKIFNAVDGSAATFISDADIYDWTGAAEHYIFPSGNLMWRDGTMYRIVNGVVAWMRDRNGNRLDFQNGVIKDSLNREVTITTQSQGASYYDLITYKGSGGANRQIKIWYRPLEEVLRADYQVGTAPYTKTLTYLFGIGSTQTVHNPLRAASVELPDGRSYQFFYNYYGELARVVLPTGGAFEYDWIGYVTGNSDIVRRVSEKRVYPNGGQGSSFSVKTVFSDNQTPSDPNNSWFFTEQRDSANNLLAHSRHYYYYNTLYSTFTWTPFQNRPYDEGREHKTQSYNTSGSSVTSLLRELQQVWTATFWTPAPPSDTRVSEKITTLADTSPALVAKEVYTYGSYNNVTRVDEYGYGSGAAGALARYRVMQYLGNSYDTNLNIHLRGLPTQEKVHDAGGTLRSQTDYEYDIYNQGTPDAFHDALTNRTNISGLDTAFTTSYYTRGNVTKTTRQLLDSGGNITGSVSGYAQYDIAGNVVKTLDPRSTTSNLIATSFDYSDNFGTSPDGGTQSGGLPLNSSPSELSSVSQNAYAVPFKVTNPLGHTAYTQYDYYLGRPIDAQDANGVKSSVYYNDALERPTKGIQAIGTAAAAQTLIVYNDSNSAVNGNPARSITTISDKDTYQESNGGAGLKGVVLYDGLGRTWRQASYEGNTGGGNTWLLTDIQFDAMGRAWKTSNPWRNSDPATTSSPSEWATTDYDALSRVTKVTTPDTAAVKTAYSGNRVIVGDQAGKKRLTETNALGQLAKVWEITSPDSGEVQVTFTGSTTSDLNGTYNANLTSYSYDTLNNLTWVAQGSQRRWFAYDSLSRLIRARNPEQSTYSFTPSVTVTAGAESNSSWSTAYNYDAASNLQSKTDARNITTSYSYDALNRNTLMTYSSYPNGSYYVERHYDGLIANGIGRFHYDIAWNYRWEKPTDNAAHHHNVVNSYDPLGRPLSQTQNFYVIEGGAGQWKPYSLGRTYDLAGNVKTQTYPSSRAVNYGYDTAGRLNSFTGKLGGITGPGNTDVNYATGIQYNGYGLTSRETYGTNTPLYLNLHYNNRLQMVDLRLGDSSADQWNANRGALIYYYGTTALTGWDPFLNSADNNGNVLRQVNYVPLSGGGTVIPQLDDYTYDSLNRVKSVTEAQMNSGGAWTFNVFTQTFDYDRWGNRTINLGATTNGVAGVTRKNFVVDTATNRLTSVDSVGMTYDAVGNQTNDGTGDRYYDAENRMTKAVQGGQSHYYFYDANGKRVRRIVNGSQTWGGTETWFLYGFEGELVAEYSYNQVTAPLASSPQKEYGYLNGKLLVVWDGTQTGDKVLKWLVTDHLGSTRMEADKSGSLAGMTRHDYLPFGEELLASTGAQRSGIGHEPPASNIQQKFTEKERDTETGLDYFGARYLASVQGRFTSSDEVLYDQYEDEPQSWNLYSYVRNNPLSSVDPNGRETCYYQNGRQVACDNAKNFGIKNNVLTYDGKSYDLNKLEAQTVIRSSGIEPGHQQNIPMAPQLVSTTPGIDPSTLKNIPTGNVPQLIPIVSGYMDFSNSTEGQVLMAIVPVPGGAGWRLFNVLRPLAKMGHAAKHLKDFQKYDAALGSDDVAKILGYVRDIAKKAGASEATRNGGMAYEAIVDIGGQSVRVRVIESASGLIRTGYPIP